MATAVAVPSTSTNANAARTMIFLIGHPLVVGQQLEVLHPSATAGCVWTITAVAVPNSSTNAKAARTTNLLIAHLLMVQQLRRATR